MDPNDCPTGAKNSTKIEDLQRRMGVVEQGILEIRDNLLGRPSWVVTTIIAFLSSVALASVTFAFAVIRAGVGA